MLDFQRKSLTCPVCNRQVDESKRIFRRDLRCKQCGSAIRVSTGYIRTLCFVSIVVGFILLWAAGKRDTVQLSMLLLPTAFVVLTITVRIAPYVVRPTLVAGEPQTHVTTLFAPGEWSGVSLPASADCRVELQQVTTRHLKSEEKPAATDEQKE